MSNIIPQFPEFRQFSVNDVQWYYDYYIEKELNPYADINPGNMLVWLNINNDLTISQLNETIIIKYTNVLDNNNVNIIPLTNHLEEFVIDKIMTYLKDNNLPQKINEIPAKMCENLDETKWQVEDARDSYEYILNTHDQSSLDGSDFSRQRRRINFFEREYLKDSINIEYQKNISEDTKEAFIHHIETMPLNSNEEASQRNISEPFAIRKNIEYASILGKKALIIRINNEIASLSMLSYLDNNVAAINHIKVDYSIQYIFQYTIYQLARALYEDGIKEMNIEQDLGIEGLRIFKERLQPSRLLEKRFIAPRHQ